MSDVDNQMYHCRYYLRFHLVLVTKYRRKVITDAVFETIHDAVDFVLEKNDCTTIEINHDKDHVHILFAATPKVHLDELVNRIKTSSSREVRKQHTAWLRKFYWKPFFWSRSYYIGSVGENTIETVENYIQHQGS